MATRGRPAGGPQEEGRAPGGGSQGVSGGWGGSLHLGGSGAGMAEGSPGGGILFDTSLLLQFCNDDHQSSLGGMEVDDRISYLEQRLQLQEDEIQVLKAALADVLRRLSACEENGLSLSKKGPHKVYQLLRGLPSRPSLSNGAAPPRRGYATSPSSPKREILPGKR